MLRRFSCGISCSTGGSSLGAGGFVVPLIRLHNALHQLVAHNVLLVKFHTPYARHSTQYTQPLHESPR